MDAISPTVAATAPTAPPRPGKSAQAVGQMAKTAAADARQAGATLPRNAQGLAASAIARGADPSSVFAARAVQDDIATDIAPETSAGGDGTVSPTSAAEVGYAAAVDPVSPTPIQDGSDIALSLLSDAV